MCLIPISKILVVIAFFVCIWTDYQIWTTLITYKGIEVTGSSNGGKIENKVIKLKKFQKFLV